MEAISGSSISVKNSLRSDSEFSEMSLSNVLILSANYSSMSFLDASLRVVRLLRRAVWESDIIDRIACSMNFVMASAHVI